MQIVNDLHPVVFVSKPVHSQISLVLPEGPQGRYVGVATVGCPSVSVEAGTVDGFACCVAALPVISSVCPSDFPPASEIEAVSPEVSTTDDSLAGGGGGGSAAG